LEELNKLEIALNKEVDNKLVLKQLNNVNNPEVKSINILHSELKDVVITKHLDIIHNQAIIISEKNKEIDRIKGNFEKILKKTKNTDTDDDLNKKKQCQTNEIMPLLDISNIIDNNHIDHILYNNKNKIIKNVPNRMKKLNKKSEQSSLEVNPNGIESNNNKSETIPKKTDLNRIVKDNNFSIDLKRINSLELLNKYDDFQDSSKNSFKKSSSKKLSQSVMKNSKSSLEKEQTNTDDSEKYLKTTLMKTERESKNLIILKNLLINLFQITLINRKHQGIILQI